MKLIAPASDAIVRMWSDRIQRSWPFPGGDHREWRIAGPARVRTRRRGEERQEEDDASEGEEPVGERVEPRERHVGCADHERHEEVAEPGEDRHDDEEDHRGAMHGDDLVVAVACEHRLLGARELGADQDRQETGEHEEHAGRGDVEDPDPLVVGGHQPARDLAALPVRHRRRLSSGCQSAPRGRRSTSPSAPASSRARPAA